MIRSAIVLFVLLTLLTGLAYPLLVTAIVQTAFPHQANGSIVIRNGAPIGSDLIGQSFDKPRYFWGRPSATGPVPYNAAASTGSNLGPTNRTHLDAVKARVEAMRQTHPDRHAPVPVDLVTTSASGLDPHITPAAAEYQAVRVAQARKIPVDQVRRLIAAHTEGRLLGLLGEPHVNVLQLNLALEAHGAIE